MKHSVIIGMIVLLSISFIQAEYVSLNSNLNPEEPKITVLSSNLSHFEFELEIPGFFVRDTSVQGDIYQIIDLPLEDFTQDVGLPRLPVINRLVGILPQSGVSMQVEVLEDTSFEDYLVYPAQQPTTDSLPPSAFAKDESFYALNTLYPSKLKEKGIPGVLKDFRVVGISTFPFAFNPAQKKLTIYKKIIVNINFSGIDMRNTLSFLPTQVHKTLAPYYSSLILNYDAFNLSERFDPQDYLIIVHDDYYDAIQSFAFWKHKMGFNTIVTKLSDITNIATPDTFEIKNHIRDQYNSLTDLCYVLLIGDGWDWLYGGIPDIPLFTEYKDQTPGGFQGIGWSDYYYALLDGNDNLPEVAIGRFNVASVTEAETMCDKIFKYERTPSHNWNAGKVLLVADNDAAPYYYQECKEWIYDNVLGPNSISTILAYGRDPSNYATNEYVTEKINSGLGLVNYRGHGLRQCWYKWNNLGQSFTVNEVRNLTNQDYLPIVFNITCSNGAIYYYEESLVEAWTLHTEGGSASALASTRASYTNPNHAFDREIFKQTCSHGFPIYARLTIGDAVNLGKIVMLSHGTMGLWNAQVYIIDGDPSLRVWTRNPKVMVVDHPTVVDPGEQFAVSVSYLGIPIEDALVCVWKDEEIFETQYTNSNGNAIFTIPTSVTLGNMYVTVTAHAENYIPYEGEAFNVYHLASNSPDALDGNNQDKLVRGSNGTLHLTYHSYWLHSGNYGDIWYTYSTDDGTTWEAETYIGNGFEPCIALNGNNPCIIWPGPSHKTLRFKRFQNGAWSEVYVIDMDWWPIIGFHLWQYPSLKIAGNTAHIGVRYQYMEDYQIYHSIRYATMNITDPVNTFQWIWYLAESDDESKVGNVALDLVSGPILAYRFDYDQVYYKDSEEHTNITGAYPICIYQEIGTPSIASYNNNPFVVWPAQNDDSMYPLIRGMYKEEEVWYGMDDLTQGRRVFPVSPYIAGPDACIVWADSYQTDPVLQDVVFCIKEGWERPMMVAHNTGDYYKYDPHGIYASSSGQLYLVYCDKKVPPYDIVFKKIDMNRYPAGPTRDGLSQDNEHGTTPLVYSLKTTSSNPFTKNTTISYSITNSGNVCLHVYDISGRLIKTLTNEKKAAGAYSLRWDGRDNTNRNVATGIYFIRLTSGEFTSVNKVMLVR